MQARTKKQSPASSTRVDASKAPGSSVPLEVYERARAAYLEHGSIAAVRKATGLSEAVAARLIDSGEPRLHLPSLRDCARAAAAELDRKAKAAEKATAHEEAAQLARTLDARAAAARRAREHEEKVLGDAVESRKSEVRLVRSNRIAAQALASVNADLLRVSGKLAESLLADVESLKKLSPRERMGILRTVAGIVQRTAQASQASVNMERLLMGEPTAILGRADGTPSTKDMTPEEAAQWLALANRAFERRAARQTVIDVAPVDAPREGDDEDVLEIVEGIS